MNTKHLMLIGAFLTLMSWGTSATAQSTSEKPRPGENVTLSGESIRGIQGRSNSRDLETFFNGNPDPTAVNANPNAGSDSPNVIPINPGVRLVQGEPLNIDNPAMMFPNGTNRSDRVQVQVDVAQ